LESCLLIYAAVTFVIVALSVLALRAEMRALANPLLALQSQYKDALFLLSGRADKESKLAEEAIAALAAFKAAVADKKGLEAAVSAERAQNEFLRERVTELQRALLALTDRRVEATVVGQTSRDRNPEPDGPVRLKTNLWQAANGSLPVIEPLVSELTRKNASTTYRPADLAGLARRESGMSLVSNDEAIS
jgi:hypothetical protein